MAARRPKATGIERTAEPLSRLSPLPPGTPEWVTAELVALTLQVWQPRYEMPLTTEDAVRILVGASQLMRTLVD